MVIWAFQPFEGCRDFAAYVFDPAEFQHIYEQGWVTLDGQRANLFSRTDPALCDPVSGFMRFIFSAPFQPRRRLELAA